MILAMPDDVPDDQKVSREAKFRDQCEFIAYLGVSFIEQVTLGWGTIALANAFVNALGQKGVHGVSARHGIVGKFIAKIVERKLEALIHNARVGYGLRKIAEERGH